MRVHASTGFPFEESAFPKLCLEVRIESCDYYHVLLIGFMWWKDIDVKAKAKCYNK